MSRDKIIRRAQELLKLDDTSVAVPEIIYANARGTVRESIKDNYLKRRKFFLQALAEGKLIHLSTDADGTCTFKTVKKVENTRSIGSLIDKFCLRLLVKAFKKIGAYFEINTARTGFIPGPSLVGTEGPKFINKDGRNEQSAWVNPRSPNEISGIFHEFGIHNLEDPENKEIFDHLIVNGLSAAARHDPRNGGSLTIAPATIKYGEFVNKLNHISLPDAKQGFLNKLEDIVADRDEDKPLRVLEYKSIPWIFIKHPDFKVKDYLNYTNLAEKSRKAGWSTQEFFNHLNQTQINLPEEYYNPANPPTSEAELTNKIRSSMLACLVPHAFDSDNIIRDDKKFEFYKILLSFARSEEAQAWAEEKYGIPKGTELVTIGNKDISHLEFEKCKNVEEFNKKYGSFEKAITGLKEKGKDPENKEHILINVVENLQPYTEMAPNTTKADVLPELEEVQQSNKLVVAAGDSPGSDAVLLAQALLLGGAGFVVRGLMSNRDIALKIIEQLTKKEQAWHEFALKEVEGDSSKFECIKTGEAKSKEEWIKFFENKYQDKILRCNNIHENNIFNASIFSELFASDPKFKLELDDKAPWVKDVLENMCQKSLATPISEAGDKALEGQVYEKSILDKIPFLKKIPLVNSIFDPQKAGGAFNTLLNAVSGVLIGAAPIEILADFTGFKSIAKGASLAQRIAYGINTIASGVSRGLFLSSHKFYWQFIGEVFGLASTFFPQTSTFGRTLRAINQTVLIGRANELMMQSNVNIDSFKDKKAAKEFYSGSKQSEKYFDKRKVAAEMTQSMMSNIEYFSHNFLGGLLGKIPGGQALAATSAQFVQAAKMTWDFITVPQLRNATLKNFLMPFTQQGLTKMSKNSGKAYGEVHEENTYAFTGISTLLTAVASTVLGSVTGSKLIDTVLTNLANMIPALGVITAGKLVSQDQAGDPRLFTDVAGKQQAYSPEKAGKLQTISGIMMAVFGAFMHTKTGAVLYNMANGFYFQGIREQLKVGVDDAAVNQLTRQGKYYRTNIDLHSVPKKTN